MKKIVALLFAVLLVQLSYGSPTERILSNKARISVLTCGTGKELYALFGHTAIRVYDPAQGIDRVYNYGLFDFRTPNFYGKFVKGDLLYFVGYDDYERFVMNYAYDNRSVVEQELNLSHTQKQKVWNNLNQSLKEENRYYIYKFIDQNCTTKVVDVLNDVLPTPVEISVEGNTATYRTILNTYLKDRYFEMLGINLIFGNKVDHPSNLLFLPDKFQLGLTQTKNADLPLVQDEITVFQAEQTENYVWWNTYWFASLLVLFLMGLAVNNVVRSVYFILFGLLGCFFFLVGFYSLHGELLWNNVVFLCNPLLILIPFVKNLNKIKSILGIIVVILLILYIVLNLYSEKLIITLPLYLLTLVTLFLEFKPVLQNRVKNK
ncbi:DUF4105 domain-containing protein [Myroides sp. DF42-4-2]|uniref:lipoprotein N-acyltransferase Lnb domain-containing protein n=1 Tax=unclassified Myroides TaxID=2642485 RepID=UPI00257526E4|nr:DUF4105 domain-containing protein [Myroides sp. DF42-4-2]MDM1407387.1 DUF4105 domain-containing protein [Myroides sp. DF42-4-2]